MKKVNMADTYLKLIDYSKYKNTYHYNQTGDPWLMYKPILTIVFPNLHTQSEEKVRTFEITNWQCIDHKFLKDIKMIWENNSGSLMYLRSTNSELKDMAEIKHRFANNQSIEVRVIEPNPYFIMTKEEYDKAEIERCDIIGSRSPIRKAQWIPRPMYIYKDSMSLHRNKVEQQIQRCKIHSKRSLKF